MVHHIPLKLRQIHGTPGTEFIVVPAPGQKLFHGLAELLAFHIQFIHRHVGYFRNFKVHLPVYSGPDQTAEFRYDL